MMNKIIICIYINIIGAFCFGQNTDPRIQVLSESTTQEIKLRWLPSTPELLEAGFAHGYNIYREDYIIDGSPVDFIVAANSRVTVISNLMPYPQSTWDMMADNEIAQFASKILYSEEANPVYQNSDLSTAIEAQEVASSKHMYAAIASDRDYSVAQGMGLGVTDTYIKNGNVYKYIIEINHPDFQQYSAQIIAKTNSIEDIQPIDSLWSEPAETEVMIHWLNDRKSQQFSYYYIERQDPGTDEWYSRNDLPHIFSEEKDNPSKSIQYRDSLEQQDVTYLYRVVGVTPFGTYGPPSSSIEVMSKPNKINIDILVHEGKGTEEYNRIGWSEIQDSVTHLVGNFDIYRSLYGTEGFEKINDQPIPATKTHYDDYEPLPSAYYIVAMTDANGYYHQSNIILIQPKDITPPHRPEGLTATVDLDGNVSVSWQPNTDIDIDGYKIFRSNRRESKFLDVHGQMIRANEFSEQLTTNFIADSIFYQLYALDQRGNRSEPSEVVALARPDKIPPSDPLLHNLTPMSDGIHIDWELSNSSDLDRHVVQRKSIHVADWTTLIEILPTDTLDSIEQTMSTFSFDYIDSLNLEVVEYQYRILAYDIWQNVSSSDILIATPLQPVNRGIIDGFAVQYTCIDTIDVVAKTNIANLQQAISELQNGTPPQQQLSLLIEQGSITTDEYIDLIDQNKNAIIAYFNQKISSLEEALEINICGNQLTWTYEPDGDFYGFKLYRKHNQNENILFKTLIPDEISSTDLVNWTYHDEEINSGDTYTYMIIGEYANSSTTKPSDSIEVTSSQEE